MGILRAEVEESRVELIENRLILGQIYSTPLPSPTQFKWTININLMAFGYSNFEFQHIKTQY